MVQVKYGLPQNDSSGEGSGRDADLCHLTGFTFY